MPKKGVKRPLGAPPTNEELSAYSETELLYKSNLFRLSTAELIKEVVPPQSSQLEVAVRALRGEILSLPPAELSWEDRGIGKLPLVSHAELSGLRLANHKVSLPWAPPEHVELVGSYLLRTVVRPSLDVDVAVRIPRACLLSKDYLDHRYVDKRQLYLAHLGAQLAKPSAATAATAAATAATAAAAAAAELRSASFVWLPHHQDPRWPVLQLRMPAVSGGWVVRLIPVLPADAFAAAKLAPERVNLRDRTSATAKGATAGADAPGAAPSPEYNNRLALEASYAPALGLLHATYAAAGASGALREATILLKVWLRQRSVQQAGGVTGFQLSLLLVHLLRARIVTRSMGAYHVFRVVLSFLAKTMLEDHPVALPPPPPPAGGGGEDEHEHEGEAGQVHAVAAAKFGRHFAWVLADSSAGVNYGAGVTRGALRELQEQAARSLRAIDSAALDDAAAFAELFTTPQPPPLKYDALFSFPLPPLSGPAAEEAVGKARAAAEAAAAAARTAGATAAAAEAAAAGGHGSARTKGSAAADATDGGTAAVALSEGVDSACAAAAEAVLSAGLSRRCGLVRSWVAPLAEQPLRRTTTSAPAPAGEGVRLHHVGVLLEPSLAAGLVDRGPAPGGEAAAAWVGLWGDKSETRRFRDGAIVHAVVWSAEEVSRHLIPVQVVRHLLRRHLGVERVASSLGCVERALRCGGVCGTWTSAAPKYIAAYEKLAAAIRQLSGLPLAVVSIQPVGAVFSHCEEFPPSAAGDDEVAAAAGDGDAACGPSLARFVVQFESSGKWPDDVSAVAALKTAFYLKMADLLDAQAAGVRCEPRRGGLAVRVDGLLLFGTIVHAKEEKLLAAAGDEPAAAALRLSTVGTAHTAAMHAIASRHAAFGPTVRLVKRWLHCQLLSGIFPPQLVELLVAHLFSPAAPRLPGSALLGFLRALWLLETHDFDAEPLLVGLDDGISPEGRAAAQRAFESARGGEGGGAAIWIATDAAPSASPWCARGPSVAAVRRVQRLAASALRCLEGTMRHATGAHGGGGADKAGADGVLVCDGDGGARLATEAEIAAAALRVFEAPLHEFDALLRLDPARVPHPELRLQGTAERAAEGRTFANLKPRGVAVLEYVRSLRCEYGHLALFFYDRHGGNTVALKWRPRAFLPLPFRPDDALGRLLVPRAAVDAAGASHAAWLLPNVPEVLEAMGAMGKPLAAQVQACSSGSRRVVGA